MPEVIQAQTKADYQAFEALITEYSAWDEGVSHQLGLEGEKLIAFFYNQPVQEEIAADYMPPAGRAFLALDDGQVGGCAALRKYGEGAAEIKRFYVKPAFRGKGMGRALLEALIAEARQIGYRRIVLESATFMTDAHRLYHSAGFQNIEPYIDLPEELIPFEVFMEMRLE
jgi:GNAT superfamily N-acetyltransferase